MTTLRDFISSRKSEIKSQIKALRKELIDLRLAEDALETAGSGLPASPSSSGALTIKEMIRGVLKDDARGATSSEIIQNIERQFGRLIERTSLSPQLSRMKEEGEVWLSDNCWVLSSVRSETLHEQPDISASGDSASHSQDFEPDLDDDLDGEVPF